MRQQTKLMIFYSLPNFGEHEDLFCSVKKTDSCMPLGRAVCGTVATDGFGDAAEIILIGSIKKFKDKK